MAAGKQIAIIGRRFDNRPTLRAPYTFLAQASLTLQSIVEAGVSNE